MTRSSSTVFSTLYKQLLNLILVLMVVLVIAGFWATQAVEKQQDTLAEWLSQSLAYPVEMAAVKINWHDFTPKIQIESVQILSQKKDKVLLTLEQLHLNPDFIKTLWNQTLHIDDISLTGLHMTVIRQGNGQLNLQGMNNEGDSTPIFAGLLVNSRTLDSFHLNNIVIDYIDQQQLMLSGRYRLAEGLIEHSNDKWHANGYFFVPPAIGKTITVDTRWQGKELANLTWQWQIETEDFVAAPFKSYLKWQDVELSQALIDTVVKGHGKADKLTDLDIALYVSDAILTAKTTAMEPVLIKHLSTQVSWLRKDNDAWSLDVDKFNLYVKDSQWPESKLTAEYNEQGELIVKSDFIRIEDIGLVASLADGWPELLSQIKPAGDLHDIELHLNTNHEPSYVSADIQQLAMLPWEDYPGVNDLTATVEWQSDRLKVDFDSQNTTVFAEQWYDDALYFDSLQGQLLLLESATGWQLALNKFNVWNDDLNIEVDGTLRNQQEQWLSDLQVRLEQVNLTRWRNYLPQMILTSGFGIWSKEAFQAGELETGSISLVGDLAHFPFDKEQAQHGHFNMQAQLKNADLNYASEWPKLEQVDAILTGKGSDLLITSKKGKIAGFDFAKVETKIAHYVLHAPVLTLQGALKGTTQDALTVLQITPLAQRFGSIASQITGLGNSDINLDLTVPLTHTDNTEVVGDVSFANSTLYKTNTARLAVSKINGLINFSHESISAKGITADLLGHPANIDVIPGEKNTIIRSKSLLTGQSLSTLLDSDLKDYITGTTPYTLDVAISEQGVGDFYADIMLDSNLQGLTLNLPVPLFKTKQAQIPLKLMWHQHQNGDDYTIQLQDIGSLFVEAKDAKTVTLSVDKLNLDDWISWGQDALTTESTLFKVNDVLIMNASSVMLAEQTFDQFSLSAQRQAAAWDAKMTSLQSSGSIAIPDVITPAKPIKLSLDNLDIRLAESQGEQPVQKPQTRMSLWPSIDIAIADLSINEMALGALELESTATETSWRIDNASVQSDLYKLTVKEGQWTQSELGESSSVNLTVSSDNLALLLANFGYQQAIEARDVNVSANLTWPGDVFSPSKSNLQGQLSFDLGQGKLTDVKAGAAGRVFGLLSVSAIPRRLALDFNDLFRKGFHFNSIKGTFNVADGQATSDDFLLKSEAANIVITGPIDIVNQTYDQRVKVTPNVSSTLPVAGAVAGGPVGLGVGAAILLVDKLAGQLFDKEIVNLISYSYNLTGPWQDPQLSIMKPDSTKQ